MTNGLMGPPLPKTATINQSLTSPDSQERFILTPQKIEKGIIVYCKFSSFKIYAVENGVPTATNGDFQTNPTKSHA